MDNIYQIVKKAEDNLINAVPIKIGKYATHDHTEKIATIDAYLNSQHISGPTDSQGREKPFYNVGLMAAYNWYKTTDIDRKHINFKPKNAKQRLKSLVATLKLRNWMEEQNFGLWLNEWGWKLSCYGSIVSKFIEKNGKLIPTVISWDRFICDPVDFYAGPRIEKLYFTPAQLRQQGYDEDAVEEAIERFAEARTNIEGQKIDVKNEYIGVYEVHGELPLSLLTGKEEDEMTYRQQMHVIFMMKNPKDKEKNIEVTLYSGKEEKDPYHLAHLLEQEGRVLSIGAFESIFDSQWMVNHTMKQIKDQLDLASKLVSQTSDTGFLGRNIMTEVDTGSVLIHKENQPLTQVNLQSHDIPQMVGVLAEWKQSVRDNANIHEGVTGEQPNAGTPFRLQAMLNQEAKGLFLLMRQNKGLYLKEILKTFVIPHFKKTLKTTDELIVTLDGEELENFDNLSLPAKISEELIARLTMDNIPTQDELMSVISERDQKDHIRVMKPSKDDKKTWKEYFADLDFGAIDIEITGESRDKGAIIANLFAVFQQMMSAPQMFSPEDVKKVYNKLLDEIGMGVLTPMQLSGASPQEGTTGGQPIMDQPVMAGGAGEVGALQGLTM
jgi:hypothetical protein